MFFTTAKTGAHGGASIKASSRHAKPIKIFSLSMNIFFIILKSAVFSFGGFYEKCNWNFMSIGNHFNSK